MNDIKLTHEDYQWVEENLNGRTDGWEYILAYDTSSANIESLPYTSELKSLINEYIDVQARLERTLEELDYEPG